MSETNTFRIQIANNIIRSPKLDHLSFVLYAKLIQIYYKPKNNRNHILKINHKIIKDKLHIKDNRTLKRSLDTLHKFKLLNEQVESLPRHGLVEVHLNNFFDLKKQDKDKEDRFMFAQLPQELLDKEVLKHIGYIGYRLMYYYSSYINKTQINQFCFTAYKTIYKETGISESTIKEYNETLEKLKLIKIDKHKLECRYEYIQVEDSDNEIFHYDRYNNHYHVKEDKIIKLYNKLNNIKT